MIFGEHDSGHDSGKFMQQYRESNTGLDLMLAESSVPPRGSEDYATDLPVRSELVRSLLRQSVTLIVGNCLVIVLLAYLLQGRVADRTLAVWTVATLGLNAFRAALSIYFQRTDTPDADVIARAWIFTVFAGLSGGLWGSAGVLFFTPGQHDVIAILCVVLLGMTGAAVAALSLFPPAYFALALPAVLPFALRAIAYGEPFGWILGLLTLGLLWMSRLHCAEVHRAARNSVLLRFENAALAQQLLQEKERAEAANRAKSRFLAAASHDLRQPTHALGLFIATLLGQVQRPQLDRANLGEIATRMQNSMHNLGQLLNALLSISRLDAGVVTVNRQAVSLQEVLAELDGEFFGPAKAKGLALHTVRTSLWVDTDPVLLHRVLSNLLTNAVRYTEQGRILFGCRRRGGAVEVQVWDTGIGIAPDQIEAIFQEFYQVGNVRRAREHGLGLGLAIVRRCAALLGAELKAQSHPGRGSMFSVRLPCVAAAPAAPRPTEAAGAQQPPLTVLAIDDDAEVLAAMQALLSGWGHQVLLARTLDEAVAAATAARSIGLVLADYRLADDATGIDALRAVLAHLPLGTHAALITGDTSPERLHEAAMSGFMLMHKPLEADELWRLLDACPRA